MSFIAGGERQVTGFEGDSATARQELSQASNICDHKSGHLSATESTLKMLRDTGFAQEGPIFTSTKPWPQKDNAKYSLCLNTIT